MPVAASGDRLRNHAWCARKYTTNNRFFAHSARPSSSVNSSKPARLKNSIASNTTGSTRGSVPIGEAARRSERNANAQSAQITAMTQPVA